MAREVIIKAWCDPCIEKGDRVEGREVGVFISDALGKPIGKPVLLTACEMHEKEFLSPLRDLIAELDLPLVEKVLSEPPAKPKKSGGVDDPQVCKWPDCGTTLKNRSTLAVHVNNQHNVTMAEYRQHVGEAAPDGSTGSSADIELREGPFPEAEEDGSMICPEGCGKTYSPDDVASPRQAMGLHLAKTHKVKYKRQRSR
jgi:hypothetical protein